MAIEIERKFLVNGNSWRSGTARQQNCQGYLCSSADRTVWVRVVETAPFSPSRGRSTAPVVTSTSTASRCATRRKCWSGSASGR